MHTVSVIYVQALDGSSGAAISPPIAVPVRNNRYQEMKAFPDGSVAYPAPGSSTSKIKILRVLPGEGGQAQRSMASDGDPVAPEWRAL